MKQCNKCKEVKNFTEFHKRTYNGVVGWQYRCKICQNEYNLKYRKEIRPKYWNSKDGYFSIKDNWLYIGKYNKADKDIKVYLMKVKDFHYIGYTKARMNVRLNTHRADYYSKNKGKLPDLHKIWDTMSKEEINESINSTIVLQTKPGTRYEGEKLEKKWIKRYAKKGYNLLNRQHNR
jgi:hypothetical protein